MSDDPYKFDEVDGEGGETAAAKKGKTSPAKPAASYTKKSTGTTPAAKPRGGLSLRKNAASTKAAEEKKKAAAAEADEENGEDEGEGGEGEDEKKGKGGKKGGAAAGKGKGAAGKKDSGEKEKKEKNPVKAPTSWKEVKAFIAVKDEDKAKAIAASIEALGGKVPILPISSITRNVCATRAFSALTIPRVTRCKPALLDRRRISSSMPVRRHTSTRPPKPKCPP
jgi:hypothetical protein